MAEYNSSEKHLKNASQALEEANVENRRRFEERVRAYEASPLNCPECETVLSYTKAVKEKGRFCSRSCSAKSANKKRVATGAFHSEKSKEKIKKSLLAFWRGAPQKAVSKNKDLAIAVSVSPRIEARNIAKLRNIAKTAATWEEFAQLAGWGTNGRDFRLAKKMAVELEIDQALWGPFGSDLSVWRPQDDRLLKEQAYDAVGWVDLLRKLGCKRWSNENIKNLRARALFLSVDLSHLRLSTKRMEEQDAKKYWTERNLRDFTGLKNAPASSKIHEMLLFYNIKQRQCEDCGHTKTKKGPIPLDLHHKNGKSKDHRPENLELLCPTCHRETDNYGHKNTRKAILLMKALEKRGHSLISLPLNELAQVAEESEITEKTLRGKIQKRKASGRL